MGAGFLRIFGRDRKKELFDRLTQIGFNIEVMQASFECFT